MFDPMVKTVLAVDPGRKTGWALVDYETEKPLRWGELDAAHKDFLWDLQKLFDAAEYMVVEDQHLDKKIMNPLMVIRLSQAAGMIMGAWLMKREQDLHAGIEHLMEPKYSYQLIKAPAWQRILRLSTRASREVRKHASRRIAELLTGIKCSENSADAICMGLAFIHRIKAREKGALK